MKRSFDIIVSIILLALTSPLFLFAAIGIMLGSRGPVFYPAQRVGHHNARFLMLKFRTMHVAQGGAVITAREDPRIFWFGKLLRRSKIDEIPQFINVLRGDMSIVGPRPEDPKIVDEFYTPWMKKTLSVRPGITSPGAIFYYAFGEQLIDGANPEQSYVERVLQPKLAIDLAYIGRATWQSDLATVLRTALAITGQVIGHPVPPARADMDGATQWVPAEVFKNFT